MFLRQIYIETRKTFAQPALWLGLVGLTLLLGVFTFIEHTQIAHGSNSFQGGLESDLISALAFYSWIGSLVYGVCAAVITANDYTDRSIQVWLARGLPRSVLLLTRLTVVFIFGFLLVIYVVLVSLILAALSRLAFFGRVDAALLDWLALGPAVLRVFSGALPYLALTVLVAILTRSPVYSAAGTVIYATVLEGLLASQADRFPVLVRYLPGQLARGLLENLMDLNLAASPAMLTVSEPRAVLCLVVMSAALAVIALLVFTRQDLGG